MIKRTLYFGNPAYLSLRNAQLVVHLPGAEGHDDRSGRNTVPVEDIGVVVLDHRQITITHGLLEALLANNCALITCDANRMPAGLMLPLAGNVIQSERFRHQLQASVPLRKQLWQQTVQCKIANQAKLLSACRKAETGNMQAWAAQVRSGDPDNLEARAAVYYWANLFPSVAGFRRDREGGPPNALLNYGYAVLRAVIARSLVASGLLPTFGIHHHNRYNAYCLADDIMEPYRPYVDRVVVDIVDENFPLDELNKEIKIRLLGIPVLDTVIGGRRSPLMVAAGQTAASLYKCFSGELRKIAYPEM